MTTETLISEVEIIWMLMPSREQELEHLRRDAGMAAHAEADDGDLGDVGRRRHPGRADLVAPPPRRRLQRLVVIALGTVKVMSVKPSSLAFWMIMSTTMLASAMGPKSPRRQPGPVGNLLQR